MMNIRMMSMIALLGMTALVSGCFQNGDDNETATTGDSGVIQAGDLVDVSYTVSWSDGEVFATNVSGTDTTALPSRSIERRIEGTFEAGNANTIWGDAVIGAHEGDTLSGSVDPRTSGDESSYDRLKVQEVNVAALGDGSIPTLHDVYDIGGQRAWITDIEGEGDDQVVTFDLNPRETRDSYDYIVTIDRITTP